MTVVAKRVRQRRIRDGIKQFAVQRLLVKGSALMYEFRPGYGVRIYVHAKGRKVIVLQGKLKAVLDDLVKAHNTLVDEYDHMAEQFDAVQEFEAIIAGFGVDSGDDDDDMVVA